MVRYRTRDLSRLLSGTARTMRRMARVTGRSDDMLIIRGVNVFPSQIEEQILTIDVLTPHYFVEITKDGSLDVLTVNVETKTPAPGAEVAELLSARIKSFSGVTCTVKLHEPGTIPRSEGKAKRIVDRR